MPRDITGRWRLVEMDNWDQAFVDLEEPGFISFKKRRQGEMRFGAVTLNLDWETAEDGKTEFSFHGFDEGDEVSGRGWVRILAGGLTGEIRFHMGDKSGFAAAPWGNAKTPKRKPKPQPAAKSKQRVMKPGEFTPEAALLWSSIAPKDRVLVLKNIFCVKCKDVAEMVRFSGEVTAGDVILTGSCAKCGHKVVRVLETSERDPIRAHAAHACSPPPSHP